MSQAVWDYQVSNMPVVQEWFGYRAHSEPSDDGLASAGLSSWPAAWTTELLDVLHVLELLVELESEQEELLDALAAAPTVSVSQVIVSGVLPVAATSRKPAAEGAVDQGLDGWTLFV